MVGIFVSVGSKVGWWRGDRVGAWECWIVGLDEDIVLVWMVGDGTLDGGQLRGSYTVIIRVFTLLFIKKNFEKRF